MIWGALGWRADIVVRKKGKSAGTRDVTYIDPVTNKKFRTMTDILIALGVKADETLGREESHADMMEGFKPSKYKFPMVLQASAGHVQETNHSHFARQYGCRTS